MAKYVGDYGQPLKGPRQVAGASLSMVCFSLVVGFVVGLLVWAVLWASTFLTNLLWVDAKNALGNALASCGASLWWLPLAFCTAGGVLIGLFTKFTGTLAFSFLMYCFQAKSRLLN